MSKNAKTTEGQRDRFIEIARKLGTDEDEAVFKEKLGAIARQKPRGASNLRDKPQRSRAC